MNVLEGTSVNRFFRERLGALAGFGDTSGVTPDSPLYRPPEKRESVVSRFGFSRTGPEVRQAVDQTAQHFFTSQMLHQQRVLEEDDLNIDTFARFSSIVFRRLNNLADRVAIGVTRTAWMAVTGSPSDKFVLLSEVKIFQSSATPTTFLGKAADEFKRLFPDMPQKVFEQAVRNRVLGAERYTEIRDIFLRDIMKPELERRNV